MRPIKPLKPSDISLSLPEQSVSSVHAKSEDELIIRLAFETDAYQGCDLLFRRYYSPLCSHAVRFVYDKSVAEDIVADLFRDFWQKKVFGRITYSYRAYLYQAVRQNCLLYLQREAGYMVSTEHMSLSDELQSTASPIDQIQFDELTERIESIVQTLSPPVRRVFLLSRFEGRKNQEIAEELCISLKTVEAHVTKALTLFRKAIRP